MYKVNVNCSNCGFSGEASFRKGNPISSEECPVCGCVRLSLPPKPKRIACEGDLDRIAIENGM